MTGKKRTLRTLNAIKIYLEYDGETRTVIFRNHGSSIHGLAWNVFMQWLIHISFELEDAGSGYYFVSRSEGKCPLKLKTFNETNLTSKTDVTPLGSSSVNHRDVTLSDPLYKPTITAEVGLDNTLAELFEDARETLQYGQVKAVFILKIHEDSHAMPVRPPWDLATVEQLRRDNKLVDELISYNRANNVRLVGNLSAHLYLWSSESPNPP